jgi:PAS domain S-box-containing protein
MQNYCLLLVDDQETNLTVLGNVFKKEGYRILKAFDGEEALSLAFSEKPDLILLDIMLPKKDGFQVCKILKADSSTSHIPIIFLTGRDDKEDKVVGFDLGAVDYITKPFDLREVKARVNTQILIKRISDELKVERDKLLAANEFIHTVLNTIPISLCVIDKNGEVISVNSTFQNVLSFKKEEYTKYNYEDVFSHLIKKSIKKDTNFLEVIKMALEGNSEFKNQEFQFSINGEEKFFMVSFQSLPNQQFIIALIDITERKLIENELATQSRLKYIGEIVIGVAHEINNPNTFIRVNNKNIQMILDLLRPILSDFAEKNPDLKAGNISFSEAISRLERANQGIYQASERILLVIERLKNFAKKDTQIMTTLDVKDVISESLMLTTYFLEKILDVEVNIPDNLPKIYGSQIELVQLFVNLITNSFHSIEEKINQNRPNFTRGKIEIVANLSQTSEEIIIKIIDNGLGIPKEIQDKVFNPFFTTKPQGKGTGLGLALCYGIVQRHDGNISFVSIPDEKTEFIIKLPYKK